MAAFDYRAGQDGPKTLNEPTAAALLDGLRAQRGAGRTPLPELQQAITAAAIEARDTGMQPEALIVQLKRLAEQAGLPAGLGEETSVIREWLVSACIEAYYK